MLSAHSDSGGVIDPAQSHREQNGRSLPIDALLEKRKSDRRRDNQKNRADGFMCLFTSPVIALIFDSDRFDEFKTKWHRGRSSRATEDRVCKRLGGPATFHR
jgi:hypothetical protein